VCREAQHIPPPRAGDLESSLINGRLQGHVLQCSDGAYPPYLAAAALSRNFWTVRLNSAKEDYCIITTLMDYLASDTRRSFQVSKKSKHDSSSVLREGRLLLRVAGKRRQNKRSRRILCIQVNDGSIVHSHRYERGYNHIIFVSFMTFLPFTIHNA